MTLFPGGGQFNKDPKIRYSYHFLSSNPQISWLNTVFIISQLLWAMSPGVAQLGPLLRASHRLHWDYNWGCSIPKLSWEGLASRVMHMATCRIQFSMDCCTEDFGSLVVVGWKSASIPCSVDLSKLPLPTWPLTSSEWASEKSPREHASKMEVPDPILEVTAHYSWCCLSWASHYIQCIFKARELPNGKKSRR